MSNNSNITDDIVALKENLDTDGTSKPFSQWLLFAFVLLGLTIAGAWLLQSTPPSRSLLIYNVGIDSSAMPVARGWTAAAAEQAFLSYLDADGEIQIVGGTDTASRPSTKAGADWILTSALSADPAIENGVILYVELHASDASHKKHRAEIKGLSTALNDLAGRASQEVLMLLGREQLSQDELAQAQAEIPANKAAQQAFAEGSLALARYDGRTAVRFFNAAIEETDEHPIISNALSAAWAQLGHNGEAKEWAERAYRSRTSLSRERQLQIEGQYRIAFDEWDRAIEIYKALKEFHPNSLSYALSVAEIELSKGDLDEAEKTIRSMRELPGIGELDARIDIIEAKFWHQKGNYAKGATFSDAAIAKAQASGENAVLAAAYLGAAANESDNKRQYLEQARALFAEIKNPRFQSAILSAMGQQERYDNRLDASVALYREALAISEGVGDEAQAFVAKHGLAIALDLKNQLKDSYELKKQTLAYQAARGAKAREAITRENIGISLFKMGRLSEAEESFSKALEMFHVVGDSIGIAWAPYHLSRIRSRQGALAEAAELASQAVDNSDKNPEGQLELNAKFEVAQILYHQGRFEEAATMFHLLQTSFEVGDNLISAGESALMLARIALHLGKFEQAQNAMQEAAKIYEDGGVTYYILDALIVRNDLAYLSFSSDIEAACATLQSRLQNSEYALISMRARLRSIRCDVLQQSADHKEAERRITAIEDEAKALGMFAALVDAGVIRAQILDGSAASQAANAERKRITSMAEASGWVSNIILPPKN